MIHPKGDPLGMFLRGFRPGDAPAADLHIRKNGHLPGILPQSG